MKKLIFTLILFCVNLCFSFSQNRVGLWKFDDASNFLKAEVGNPLTQVGAGIQKADGPDASNGAVTVKRGTYFVVDHGIPAKSGATNVNEYSLVVDFKIPTVGVWYNFFQTDPTNTSDGDCFINTSGNIGTYTTGYSSFAVSSNKWYRLVVSVNLDHSYKYYLDGNLIQVGNVQYSSDGRFSLAKKMLLFADDNGEDGTLDVAEVSLYDGALNDAQVADLGGYGHTEKYKYDIPVVKPYLQTPGSDYMYVSWQDTSTVKTQVNYGTTTTLTDSKTGTYETINSYPYIWHTVKLTDLQPNTKYYYQVVSGSGESPMYSFRTQPDKSYSDGHIRFLLFGDTQQNPDKTTTIVNSAVTQMKNLFGDDYADSLNFVLHTGDCIQQGNSISAYTTEFLHPMEPLSCRLPFAIAPGNHEVDSPLFYSYMKFNDITPFSTPEGIFERFWSFKVARTLFVGLNSNIVYTFGDQEKTWFEQLLKDAENDPLVDRVFCFIHHCPYSELWSEGESQYSRDMLDIMRKYSKAQQLSFGHTHDYENGTITSLAPNSTGDISFVCGGGGGGDRDYFSSSAIDRPTINMSYTQNFFIYADIDVKNKSHVFKVYGVGDLAKNPTPNLNLIDSWYRKLNQVKPETPSCASAVLKNDSIHLLSSPFVGLDNLMSVEVQATSTPGDYSSTLLDVTTDWRNIYGIDSYGNARDLNKGINLLQHTFSTGTLVEGKTYAWRTRYRDHNLKWSDWSNEQSFKYSSLTGINNVEADNGNIVKIVNPIRNSISMILPGNQKIQNVVLYDIYGHLVLQSTNGDTNINATGLAEGVYIVKVKIDGKYYYLKCVKK
ncbi:fibronectin type III domain-containing protein [uncultured Bacteroides sp.]|uniref:fibronectin type III domain-containing protein n=1 Tax=uncultured Bacteroides sp. TaxID=162156 RepID=UPI002AAB253E|nr:metallophosphoesterase [uncultured Bacteroides sp.]